MLPRPRRTRMIPREQALLKGLNGDAPDVRLLMKAGLDIDEAMKRAEVAKALAHANITATFDRIEQSIRAAGGLRD